MIAYNTVQTQWTAADWWRQPTEVHKQWFDSRGRRNASSKVRNIRGLLVDHSKKMALLNKR